MSPVVMRQAPVVRPQNSTQSVLVVSEIDDEGGALYQMFACKRLNGK